MKFSSIILLAIIATMAYGTTGIKKSNPVCDFCVSSINFIRSDEVLLESSKQSNRIPQSVMNLIESEKSAETLCELFEKCESTGHANDRRGEYDEAVYFDIFKGGRNRRKALHTGGKVAKESGINVGTGLICQNCHCC